MIDHIGIAVRDLAKAKEFYTRALAPLGYGVILEFPGVCGLGFEGKPDFWIHPGEPSPIHIGFASPDRATVDRFHEAALEAGGRDNGAPGPRPQYHADYYGAFVLDPDGNNVEAVCHSPEET